MSDTTPEGPRPARELDPEIRRFMEIMAADAARFPLPEALSFPEARRVLEQIRSRWTDGGPEMAATVEHEVPGRSPAVRVRFHLPGTHGTRPVLIYLHGGGWTYFSLETHDRLMREYAARADVVVAGVDYVLSPEHKYPVALGQVIDVVRWVAEAAPAFGCDGARLGIGGDSAGANLAVAACLALRDAGDANTIKGMVLNYGAFEAHCSEAAEGRYGGPGYMLGAEEMRRFWRNYVRDTSDFEDPLVCPLRADLAGLPPAFFAIPECDILAEQNRRMAGRLRDSGVPVEAVEYEGATHSFLEAVSVAGVSERALADTARWLRGNL